MLLKLFRGTGPGVMFLVLLIAAGVWTATFIDPQLPSSFHYDLNPMPFYSLIKGIIGKSAVIGVLFSFILVLLMSFLLVNFNTTIFFINERTFLPAFIYVLFTGFFPGYQVLNPVLPASLFLMLAIRRIMDAYRINGTAYNFFDASLLIGTGSLFYANLIWFAVLVIIGIAILRTFNLRELILSILGLCTPMLITAGVYYSAGKDLNLLVSATGYNLFQKAGDHYFSGMAIAGLIIIGVCILISLFHLLSVMNVKKIKSRKTFSLLIWAFVITIVVFYLLPSASVELIYVAAIPLSYFLTHYFVSGKKQLVPEILFTVFFITIVVQQILYRK
jgi:hypothetical protein